ncbi:8577_t:CDS:1, partial [Gigaspora rosea]
EKTSESRNLKKRIVELLEEKNFCNMHRLKGETETETEVTWTSGEW